ncbi:MAG: hypothetical protein ACK5MQ_06880 [Pikeienuella sp.]
MSIRLDVLDALDAVQADRRAADAAGEAALVAALHEHLVTPLNRQLARIAGEPSDDAAELALLARTMREGLAKIAGGNAALIANSAALSAALDARTGAGAAPTPSVNPDLPQTPPAPALDLPGPIPAGAPGVFVHARAGAPQTVIYVDARGRDVIRRGGSRSWRNNNPGNIRKGDFALNNGAIGDDGAFACFPDEKTGLKAIETLLRGPRYAPLTLEQGLNRYAPPSENQTSAYVTFVKKETGIKAGAILGDLPVAQIRKIVNAIRMMEGWTRGAEEPNAPPSGAAARASGGVSAAIGAAHEWMAVAEREAALPERERSEWADPGENPRILEYFRVGAAWFEPPAGDETDWCAAFVNYCLIRSGHYGTEHPGARSFFWNRKNQFVRLPGPKPAAIAVRRYAPFDDPAWSSGPGHVGFVTSFTASKVTLLGGNQRKTVRRLEYPLKTVDAAGSTTSEFVAFMMPVMN